MGEGAAESTSVKQKAGFRWWTLLVHPGERPAKLISPIRETHWRKPSLKGESGVGVYACPSIQALKLWQDAPHPDLVVLAPVSNGFRIVRVECCVPGLVVATSKERPMVEWWMFSVKRLGIACFGDTYGVATRPLSEVIDRGTPLTVRIGEFSSYRPMVQFKEGNSFLRRANIVNRDEFAGEKLKPLADAWGVKIISGDFLQGLSDQYQMVSKAPQFLRAHGKLPSADGPDTRLELARGIPEIVMSGAPREVVRWARRGIDAGDTEAMAMRDVLALNVSKLLRVERLDEETEEWAWGHARHLLMQVKILAPELHRLLTSEQQRVRDRAWKEAISELRSTTYFTKSCYLERALLRAVPSLLTMGETEKVKEAFEFAKTAKGPGIAQELMEVLPVLAAMRAKREIRLAKKIVERTIAGDVSSSVPLVEFLLSIETLGDRSTSSWAWGLARNFARNTSVAVGGSLVRQILAFTDLDQARPWVAGRAASLIRDCVALGAGPDISRQLAMNQELIPPTPRRILLDAAWNRPLSAECPASSGIV